MSSNLSIISSGDHRLPLDHKCLQWSRVDKQLVQCDICQSLIKAPEIEKLTPTEAVSFLFRCIMDLNNSD